MAKKSNKKKIRAQLRKKHDAAVREKGLTREFEQHGFENQDPAYSQRVSGKGDLTRKRTIIGDDVEADETGFDVHLDVDPARCQAGRVLAVHGLTSTVQAADGQQYQCATRQLLKTLNTDQRHVVAAGDRVSIRMVNATDGMIQRIEPRRGIISRTSRRRQHVLVVNVDQMLIIASAAEPHLKPNLIDRFLITAEKSKIRPVVCINKIDLIDPADLQPLAGVYGRMGYEVLLLSVASGFGIGRLKQLVAEKQSVVVGQSGVGKSSLLNAIEPGLQLRVRTVSEENQKGRHTTSGARLIPLAMGGYVVDTPGIRQFQLWDVIPEEVAGFFRDLRPYESLCRFPDCTHTHEADCAVKDAVADGHLDARRYESFCHIFAGDE